MNKELEAILLSENEDRLEKINDFLKEDYKQTLREMFVVLLNSVKTKAYSDIETIMYNIETIILNQDSKNFKTINSIVRETNYKIQDIKRCGNDKEIKKIKFRLVDLNRKMQEKKDENTNTSLYNFYSYLVFEEKNIKMIELVLKNETNLLSKIDEFGNNILYNIIEHYCSLNEEDKNNIEYFYEVITLILKSEENKLLKEDKQIYLDLLNRCFCKNKEHIKEIIVRFQEFSKIDLSNLERKYNIHSKVSDEVLEEIKTFKHSKKGRKYINSKFITIDEEDAKCLDDAISLRKNKDGSYYYHIAITDIPSVIPFGSATFYDAMKKIETLYLCDRIVSMFPEYIADYLCSLVPGVKRNAIVYRVLVDPSYNIDYDSLEIIPGRIKVSDKLTYRQVNKKENISDEISEMLDEIAMIAFKLKSENKIKEKYRKIENMINSRATYHHSMFADNSISANIIQESMLLVNHLAPKEFDRLGLNYIYRNLKIRSDAFISSEADRLIASSHIDTEEIKYKQILNLLYDAYLGAYYSTENLGHEGLGYDFYSHSTSAARRFGDSFNQFLTHEQLFNGPISDEKYYELETMTKEVVTHINQKKKENSKFENEYNYLNGKKLIRKR